MTASPAGGHAITFQIRTDQRSRQPLNTQFRPSTAAQMAPIGAVADFAGLGCAGDH
jgi:hypothetical protein